MNRRNLFGWLLVAPSALIAGKAAGRISITKTIRAPGISDDVIRQLPAILAESNRKLMESIKNSRPPYIVGSKGPELFIPSSKVDGLETKTFSAEEIAKIN